MGSKIGLILSMLFVFLMMLVGVDMISVQTMYSDLDAVSMNAGYYISKSGGITASIATYVKESVGGEIYCANDDCINISHGDTYYYVIKKSYVPLIIKQEPMVVSVKRSVVIGLYN